MNSKTLIGGLLGTIVSFLAGYLVYGLLLKDFFIHHTISYPGMTKDPMVMWAIVVANFGWGFATAYIFNMANIRSVAKGLMVGFVISCLFGIGNDFIQFAQFNLVSIKVVALDIALGGVLGALVGAVVAWWLGRGTKAVA